MWQTFIHFALSLILVDPEIYVPRNDEERYNEVDFDAINNEDQKLKTEVAVESVVIIVLASILGKLLYNRSTEMFFRNMLF